jgi:GTP-binding protein Era
VITKEDLGSPERIGYIKAEMLQAPGTPLEVVSVLKNKKEAVLTVLNMVKGLLPEANGPMFDPEIPTTENIRDMAGEIVREKCFEELSEEIPYGLGVKIQSFKENEGKATHIIADIIVDKPSHKPIVIGRKGDKIKAIGTRARQDIEKLIDSKVFLEVHVVVKEKWTKNKSIMKDLGYVQE